MIAIILVVHIIIAVALVGIILIQRSEGGGLGIGGSGGGGGMAGFMTGRDTANLLTRTTAVLAAAFFATSIVLAIFASQGRESRSVVDTPAGAGAPPATSEPASPAGPAAPKAAD